MGLFPLIGFSTALQIAQKSFFNVDSRSLLPQHWLDPIGTLGVYSNACFVMKSSLICLAEN